MCGLQVELLIRIKTELSCEKMKDTTKIFLSLGRWLIVEDENVGYFRE